MGLVGTPVYPPSRFDRPSRDPAKVALRKQQHEYRERAITHKALDAMWDGLRMAVKHHHKHYGGDKHNKHDVHRAEKVQLDRIDRINADWKVKIEKKFACIDVDPYGYDACMVDPVLYKCEP
jgi:hypothetical protein